jgi:tRNA-2-methylthio-N6-dimethylallyladenosine synthase
MNDYDSLIIESILLSEGYERASCIDDASVIIVNGCSVREHAEERAMGFINSVSVESKKKKKIILAGCLARSLKDIPEFIDAAVSPTEYKDLPEILKNNFNVLSLKSKGDYTDISINSGITLLTPISKGCDNFCSYCIVPYLRGREESFSSDSILKQIKRSKNLLTREILLMGQNVNSYLSKGRVFTDILSDVLNEFGDMRVRFITSHPKDFSIKIIEMMAENKNLCRHLHLPVQSGSDRILSLMHRKYTADDFREIVRLARKILPDITITTDIMTGMPEESEKDFEETLNIVNEIQFDDAFMYKYSGRRFTLSRYFESVSSEEGLSRLGRLIKVQQEIKKKKVLMLKGKTLEVLSERESKKSKSEFYGRDSGNRSVIIRGMNIQAGKLYNVKINEIAGLTPLGDIAEEK